MVCLCGCLLFNWTGCFHADDGRLVGNNPDMLQEGLNIIVELFRRMGLEMNSCKTKAMIFFGSIGSHRMSSEAYAHRFDKSLPTQQECVLQKVRCPKCSKSVTRQHLTLHLHEVHAVPMLQLPSVSESGSSQTYYIDFPIDGFPTPCPVRNCPASPTTRATMRRHFSIMHDLDIVIILQEGEFPRCPFCRMFTRSVGPKHFATATCRSQTARVFERERITRQAAQANDNSILYQWHCFG